MLSRSVVRQVFERWPIALRASLALGAAAALGWPHGGAPAGLLATLGAYTSLYGSDRPYPNRAVVLAAVGLAITGMVVAGMAMRPLDWRSATLIVLAAAAVTFVTNAARTGPPGAYLIVLAGAAGTSLPARFDLHQVALLVGSGAAASWIIHMAGAFYKVRGPERRAVVLAAEALQRFAQAQGEEARADTRRAAGQALYDAWSALVTFQPGFADNGPILNELRAITRETHRLFASEVVLEAPHSSAGVAQHAADLARAARHADGKRPLEKTPLPLGRLRLSAAFVDSLRAPSAPIRAAARVGVACAVAAGVALTLGFSRPYWAIAAAVLVLYQDMSWSWIVRRAWDRMLGTMLGLLLAALLLISRPHGLELVLILMALQFVSELLVVRRYAVAAIFITASALAVASGGQLHTGGPPLLLSRGVDTVIGCLAGLLVQGFAVHRSRGSWLSVEADRAIQATAYLRAFIERGEVTSLAARAARRDLQHRLLTLANAQEQVRGRRFGRQSAERRAADIPRIEQQGYEALAACWLLEWPSSAFMP